MSQGKFTNLPPRPPFLFIVAALLTACPATPPDDPAIGYVDHPAASVVAASQIAVRGWALDSAGVAKVELVLDSGVRFEADYGTQRQDVAAAYPGYEDSEGPGFELTVDVDRLGRATHRISLVVTDRLGNETTIAERILIPTSFRDRW